MLMHNLEKRKFLTNIEPSPRRNAGNPQKCTEMYRRVVSKYAPLDPRLQKALQDAEGRSTGSERGSQGWILRAAMDRVVQAPPARGVMVNGNSKVTTADIAATNGVVHIIDTVLMPTSNAPPKASKDIVQLAQGSAGLSTLVSALQAGGLVSALQGTGPFTVFAPTNAAFRKLPKAALNRLLQPQNKDELVGILTYHVLPGSAVYSKDLQARQEVKTLQGEDVLIEFPSRGQIMADIQEAIRDGVPIWCVLNS